MPNRGVSSGANGKTFRLPHMGIKERLTEIRNEVGSNAELARAAGVSRATVTQWMDGDIGSLKAVTALTIQENTGYSALWLVLNKGPKKIGASPQGIPDIKPKEEPDTDNAKLVALVNAWLETDKLGRDGIWAGVRRAVKRIAAKRSNKKPPSLPSNGGGD